MLGRLPLTISAWLEVHIPHPWAEKFDECGPLHMQVSGGAITEFSQTGIRGVWDGYFGIAFPGQCQDASDMVRMIMGTDHQVNVFRRPSHYLAKVAQHKFFTTQMHVNN